MPLHKVTIPLVAVLAAALAGCATKESTGHAPKPANGIVEYYQITTGAIKAVRAALDSLQRVSGYTNDVPSGVRSAFTKEVERLEVGSLQVRARSQAILARGDAYFENWQDNLARMEDPRVRQLASEHRPQLESSFGRIRSASQRARESFQPFLSGLRKLRTALEISPNAMAAESGKELARITADRGRPVEQELAAIREELKTVRAMLTPANPASKH